ncbi:MAG: hypothetical protein A2Y10_09445 [Planctomycetes bacterium GWF2_41_51]|nr:MAG: hypothetical protein A2Y10_09445 [Planctomycetes bacterium GWF2_41_51]
MRHTMIIAVSILMMLLSGCESLNKTDVPAGTFQKGCIFTPQKISFNQLTEISQQWQITAYIDVYDQYNSRIKAPGIWRFELYSKVPRSADPAGGRIHLWPDLDLTQALANNGLWQDYLRCYKFELNLDADLGNDGYILEAICYTADGKSISDTIELKR